MVRVELAIALSEWIQVKARVRCQSKLLREPPTPTPEKTPGPVSSTTEKTQSAVTTAVCENSTSAETAVDGTIWSPVAESGLATQASPVFGPVLLLLRTSLCVGRPVALVCVQRVSPAPKYTCGKRSVAEKSQNAAPRYTAVVRSMVAAAANGAQVTVKLPAVGLPSGVSTCGSTTDATMMALWTSAATSPW